MKHMIAIVPHRVEEDAWPTYFVDLVTEDASGRLRYVTLRVADSAPHARLLAAEYQRSLNVQTDIKVFDPTLIGVKP